MKERPILFSAPMVRAILEGRKTQTRRVVKFSGLRNAFKRLDGNFSFETDHGSTLVNCPLGKPGDRLWVRENMHSDGDGWWFGEDGGDFDFPVDGDDYRDDVLVWMEKQERAARVTVPSIHMPRWASRIDLEITAVRVERLQDITEADAIAEGATSRPNCCGYLDQYTGWSMDWSRVGLKSRFSEDGTLKERDIALASARSAFGSLINRLHGGENWNLKPSTLWDENPWVWVVEFKQEVKA